MQALDHRLGRGPAGTLAWLFRGLSLAAALWVAALLWWGWHSGRPLMGAALAGAMLLLPAAMLALECLLAAAAHGDDPTPRPGWAAWVRAWWGEVRVSSCVFFYRQPWRAARWPDHLPPNATGRRGVLLVHGFVCNRGVWSSWLQRLRGLDVPCVALNLQPVFGSIDEHVALLEAAMRRLEAATGLPPVVVAHSMGGLVLRRWWAEHGDAARVHHAITLGTPHRGTWLARWSFSANTRQMRQGSGWLQALVARETAGLTARLTCYYGHCDNIVFPPLTATLPGADNRHLAGVAHVAMIERDEPWGELLRRLGLPVVSPR